MRIVHSRNGMLSFFYRLLLDENNEICQEFSRVVSEIETVMAAKSTAQLNINAGEIDPSEKQRPNENVVSSC